MDIQKNTKTLKEKLINKLEKDVENITNKLKEGKNNNYNKARLKAFRTKSKEILDFVKDHEEKIKH